MSEAKCEYVVTLYGPEDDSKRGNGPPVGENPFHLFDYQASLGEFTQDQLKRFLDAGKFSPHRTKPLCPCCPHLFVVEPFQNDGTASDLQHFQATLRYDEIENVRVHATHCRQKGQIVAEVEWLKDLAARIRGEKKVDKPKPTAEKPERKNDNKQNKRQKALLPLKELAETLSFPTDESENVDWVLADNVDGVKTQSLRTRRSEGERIELHDRSKAALKIALDGSILGRDPQGRVWWKLEEDSQKVFYYRKTLPPPVTPPPKKEK